MSRSKSRSTEFQRQSASKSSAIPSCDSICVVRRDPVVRLDLRREAVLPEPERLDHLARKLLPVGLRIRREMRVEVAYRAVHLGGHDEAVDLRRLAPEARNDDGELLAHGRRRRGLAVRVREHRNLRPFLRHRRNLRRHLVHRGAEDVLAVAEHQRVRHVVDVLARAGEVDELAALLERSALHLLLEKVLDCLYVVVRRLLDVLDALRVGDRELGRNRAKRLALLRGERLALLDLLRVAQRLEPRALHEDASPDEAVLRKDLLKFRALVRVAPVDRGYCRKCVECHNSRIIPKTRPRVRQARIHNLHEGRCSGAGYRIDVRTSNVIGLRRTPVKRSDLGSFRYSASAVTA